MNKILKSGHFLKSEQFSNLNNFQIEKKIVQHLKMKKFNHDFFQFVQFLKMIFFQT